MEKHLLEEFRRAAGLTGTRFPEYRLDEKKTSLDPKVYLDDLHHDFNDLIAAINSGEGGDPLTSAIARLRADLKAIDQGAQSVAVTSLDTQPALGHLKKIQAAVQNLHQALQKGTWSQDSFAAALKGMAAMTLALKGPAALAGGFDDLSGAVPVGDLGPQRDPAKVFTQAAGYSIQLIHELEQMEAALKQKNRSEIARLMVFLPETFDYILNKLAWEQHTDKYASDYEKHPPTADEKLAGKTASKLYDLARRLGNAFRGM